MPDCAPNIEMLTQDPYARAIGCDTNYHYHYLVKYLSLHRRDPLPVPVPMDGNCGYASIRRQMEIPRQYTTTMLRRQLAHFAAHAVEYVFPIIKEDLLYSYGAPGDDIGPFSFVTYLEYLCKPGSYADTATLKLVALLFGVKITVILMPNVTERRILHSRPLSEADIVLILYGQHYSSISELTFSLSF